MTWETYAINAFQVEEEEVDIDHIDASNGYVDVILTDIPETEPNSASWPVYIKKNDGDFELLTITNTFFDGEYTATLYFDELTVSGNYTIRIDGHTDMFTVTAE